MSEEPSLPRLPAVSWDEQSQSFSNNPRKRVRNQRTGNASPLAFDSSDPAIFSSDDDPGLDNYVEGRRKKRYVGSWFQQHPTSTDSAFGEGPSNVLPRPKRTFKRDFDSGVFLGSDFTDCDDIIPDGLEVPVRPRLPQLDKQPMPQVSEAELTARRKIQDCLEKGNETIDLWSLGLEEISNDTIGQLSQFACIPVVTKDVAFEQKDPELKLFLALNRLSWIPGALFDLTHLTVLSLRGNKLAELPPAISRLPNLRQLNVSQNRLQHLPAEFLDLLRPTGKLRELSLYPNPYLQPERQFGYLREDGSEGDGWSAPLMIYTYSQPRRDEVVPRFMSRALGRSPLQISDSSGRVISDFKLPSRISSEPLTVEATTSDLNNSPPPSLTQAASPQRKGDCRPSVVPSLVEAALRNCYRSSLLHEMESVIPDGLSHLQQLIRRAIQQKDIGGITCSRCRKLIVMPPIEWIEWREIKTCAVMVRPGSWAVGTRPFSRTESEMAVPFLYRACSWRCRPMDSVKEGWGAPAGFSSVEEVNSQQGPE